MTKRLPRTSRRTLDDLRNAANDALAAAENSDRSSAAGEPRASPETPPLPAEIVDMEIPPATGTQATQSGLPADVHAPLLVAHPIRERPSKAAFQAAAGRLIVERHANLAAVAGLVPMPWVDLAAIAIIVDRMLRKLARLHGRPLDRDRSRQLAAAMLTGMAAPGIGSFATSGLLRMTPGPHLLGMAITSASAAILVRVVGEVYLAQLGGLGGEDAFDVADRRMR